MTEMVKVDLITGFLGSGKTTFLKKYARFLMDKGLRIGILEYDYGAVNVDMLLLSSLRCDRCELEMLAAACDADCLERRFRTKLISMAMSGYDRVIIEPSGIFDMDMFFDALREEPLEKWYEIGSVITIVSADLPDDLSAQADYYLASQASSAGRIILSRTQLVTEADIERTKAHIRRAAQEIKCNKYGDRYIDKCWDDFEESDFLAIAGSGYYVNDCVKIIAGEDSSFSSVSFLNVPEGIEGMKKKLEMLFDDAAYGKVMRVKGFIGDVDESTGIRSNYEINATSEGTVITASGVGQNTMIVIGDDLDEDRIKGLIMA